ncbi:MAG: hypothetical protein WC679_08925 [Bacteroidales bacterium]|jgi:hypothetical protein
MEDIKWIFSGIGVLIISLIIGSFKYLQSKKEKEKRKKSKKNQSQRIINQYGDKSLYIEDNDGDITIN